MIAYTPAQQVALARIIQHAATLALAATLASDLALFFDEAQLTALAQPLDPALFAALEAAPC